MRFLFIARQKKNVDTFRRMLAMLGDAGHEVVLAVQDRDPAHEGRVPEGLEQAGVSFVACPVARGDAWRTEAPLLRSFHDWVQYSRPSYRHAGKLRQRAFDRLGKEWPLATPGSADALGDGVETGRLRQLLALVEHDMPSDPLHEEFIGRQRPDVVVVTPGVHFGSAQADFVKSARALGIPVWMLLFSWDNLSTKGALHVAPDLMFVWNERQRLEAQELHDYPADRVVVVGAPRFDEFFTLRPELPRADFFQPLGLDPLRPTILYVCSSRFVAGRELPFLRQWLAAVRSAPSPTLASCNVIVRPHPDIPLVDEAGAESVTWRALRQAAGHVHRPFDDERAIVLRTTYRTQQAFFECLYHSVAVVGLNTSAELEAGIVGRAVLTAKISEGQSSTLHFNYLLEEHGGFVRCASGLNGHVTDLAGVVEHPPDGGGVRRFIDTFLRPRGTRPVSELLAEELAQRAEARGAASAVPGPRAMPLPVLHRTVPPSGDGGLIGELRVAYPGVLVRVRATPETDKYRRHGEVKLNPQVLRWLDEDVRPGDVVYDVDAGVGTCALVAAVARGAVVVAFEPGFRAFAHLCDNILLNGCGRAVIPLSVALGSRPGLRELEYLHVAGDDRHHLRASLWKPRTDSAGSLYVQPAYVERLDDLVSRHGLTPPDAMRLSSARNALQVLEGAAATLADPRLRSILVVAQSMEERQAVLATLAPLGFVRTLGPDEDETMWNLRFRRDTAARETKNWRRLAFWT